MTAPIYKSISSPLALCTALALSACGGSDGESPANPGAVSVNVSPKAIDLSWNAVPDANYYRVLKNADGNSGFEPVSGHLSTTSFTADLAAHFTDWENVRYLVEACNKNGCAASDDIFISSQMLKAIGYIKADTPDPESIFGFSIALSADGSTLAAGSPRYDVSRADSTIKDAGLVFIYQKTTDGWAFRQRLQVPAEDQDQSRLFGYNLSLSDDGKVLAIGAPYEDREPTETVNKLSDAGAVYVFRKENDSWQLNAHLTASNIDARDYFGLRVALSGDGNQLAVGAPWESGNGSGINGDESDNSTERAGAVYLYSYANSSWSQHAYIKPSTPSQEDVPCFDPRPPSIECNERSPSRFGYSLAFANDGQMLAVGAPGDSSIAGGINGDEEDYRGKSSGAVHILRMVDGQWQHTDYIKAAYPRIDDEFGYSLSLSADGTILAVGAPYDDSSFDGIFETASSTDATSPPPTNTVDSGAAYVFHYLNNEWQQSLYIKPEAPVTDGYFGWHLALSSNGHYLAVGSPRDESSAKGVTDDWHNSNAVNSGAVYIYDNQGDPWSLTNYVKASNTRANDTFGRTLALSADGSTLAVAATGEDSNATGVGGNQENNDSLNSGAVYLY